MNCYKLLFALSFLFTLNTSAQYTLRVDVSEKGAKIKDEMYGVFFEDINFGADGGIYAELIKNRSFEFHQPLTGWTPFGLVEVKNEAPCFDRNPNYISITENGKRRLAGIENEGFKGIGVKRDNEYKVSFYSRTKSTEPLKAYIEIINSNNDRIGESTIEIKGNNWNKYESDIKVWRTDGKCKFRVTLISEGTIDFTSLIPYRIEASSSATQTFVSDCM